MESIKFRVWDKRKEVMREVAVLHFNKLTKKVSGVEYWTEELSLKSIPANYINVMRYTGLKDENGVEIYEGDCFDKVFKMIETPAGRIFEQTEVGIVKFYDGQFTCHIDGWGHTPLKKVLGYQNKNKDYWKNGLIIGNIYENKELLHN